MLYGNFKKSAQHIDKMLNAQSREEVLKNRMWLKATIEIVRFLALQGIGFRGHDESSSSLNRGNFIEVLKCKAEGNDELSSVILDNAPQNAQYIAPSIQKEVLHILANRVRKMICDEIAGGKYCILVDEAQDESNTEQLALVLRYVKHDGLLMERFFAIEGVENTSVVTLKDAICVTLGRFDLSIQNLRVQGYDGASNMRGEWNGLQALFLKDCPFAYYVHCFAHRLQLALVAAAKDEMNIWQFFSHLTCIVNLVASSPKRLAELKSFQRDEIACMLSTGEREYDKGANQIGTLHRARATRWSSHYDSVKDLIDMYNASCRGTGRHFQQPDHITVEHQYHFDIFNSAIDLQLMELEHRFNNEVVELLTLSSALDPSDSFKSFNVEKICNLAEKFYPWDFTGQDVKTLKFQLMHYQLDVSSDPKFQNISSLTDLSRELVVSKKFEYYALVDRLIRLVLTLPVSTTTTERAFSGMKRVKTAIRSKIGDEFLADYCTGKLAEVTGVVPDDTLSLSSVTEATTFFKKLLKAKREGIGALGGGKAGIN
ncbi:uncharacterized protein LOC132296270 [Cornus florida]|uniref:uncharacterized protein LOC132296270 n=1 Tax=Cornus florida TaxID=4283 RepID=UPI0028A2553C|nr:uncharacterized protein LOC132296270 [Cornus florida]